MDINEIIWTQDMMNSKGVRVRAMLEEVLPEDVLKSLQRTSNNR
jgi:hypothetical protein